MEQEAPTQVSQAPADPLAEQVTNVEFMAVFLMWDQVVTAQANRKVVGFMNPNMGTMAHRCGSLFPNCAKCRRKHEGECLAGSNACFSCGKIDHKIRHCPSIARDEGDIHRKAQPYPSFGPSGSGTNAPKQNRFYALQTRGEQESSPDVVTDMLKVFQLDVYDLLDPGYLVFYDTIYGYEI
ncbi:hypothetical protein MTR67_043952 [Solanum verrucosum]|uniref:CCHC-type domain-containing protein n=1 Tax=Solanum verrucosum TaxID=315347 RepID=A0AAF0ZSH5_SOLVR|nr:hypothetical protein MTR67_043952 [Solanum verrucosum]